MDSQHPTTWSSGMAGHGISAAAVVVISWVMTLCHAPPMPAEVAAALMVLVSGLVNFAIKPALGRMTLSPGITTSPKA
jgi:hypothetical protein